MKHKKKKLKVCKLTAKQNKDWLWHFSYFKDDGYSDSKADKLAFRELVKTYPKLKKCDKIK